MVLCYKPFISKVLRYGPCVTKGSHSFTCHPHINMRQFVEWNYGPFAILLYYSPTQTKYITAWWSSLHKNLLTRKY